MMLIIFGSDNIDLIIMHKSILVDEGLYEASNSPLHRQISVINLRIFHFQFAIGHNSSELLGDSS